MKNLVLVTGGDLQMKYLLLSLALALGLSGVAYADKCGSGDRVDLPSCAKLDEDGTARKVTNNCPETITVKFDIRSGELFGTGDERHDIKPGASKKVTPQAGRWIEDVKCCPRYSSCEF